MVTSSKRTFQAFSSPLYAMNAKMPYKIEWSGLRSFHQIGSPKVSGPVFLSPLAQMYINPNDIHAVKRAKSPRSCG
jgi:hypothetical protein